MVTEPAAPPLPAPAGLSEVERVIDTFIAPGKTFTDLRRSASWWLPFLIAVIVASAFNYVVDQKVGFVKVIENQIRLKPKQEARIEQLPPDQRDRIMQQQGKFWRVFTYAAPLFGLVFYLVIAAVFFGTLKFAGGGDARFGSIYAMVVYAWLPANFVYLIAILSLVAGVSADSFFIQNPAATNLGALIDPVTSPVLYALLSSIDVFTFWSLILMAIGLPCISKVKRGTATAIVFGWFAFWVLVKMGIAAIS